MKLVLASRNSHKIREWQQILRSYHLDGFELISLDEAGIFGEIEENGNSFEENAAIKASAAAESGYLSLGEDSGLEVFALGGAPGIYSARYAGEHGNDAANNARLLSELKGNADRSARFVCTIVLADPKTGSRQTFRGEACGTILEEMSGTSGFGYDPLFWYDELGKTFAEMSESEKNAVSHRARAIRQLVEFLKTLPGESEKQK